MQNLKKLFSELGISKVRLAKYLGVSRQMLYNYLAEEKLENWPKEKVMKILCLLGIKDVKDLDTIKVDGEYIIQVENRLNEGVKDENSRYYGTEDLKGLNKKEQELLSDIICVTLRLCVAAARAALFLQKMSSNRVGSSQNIY